MLKNLKGTRITRVPHEESFRAVKQMLGDDRVREVREGLNAIVDEMKPNAETGLRTFSSSYLGSNLSPWPYPLAHLHDVAKEIDGGSSADEHVKHQAALYFGLFVWECIMHRKEHWIFYDPNLSSSDPNKEIIGKSYFESG